MNFVISFGKNTIIVNIDHCREGGIKMQKYECIACGYIYDPELGDPDNDVAPGTAWENVPEDWLCPLCGVGKDQFEPVD
jgi:rubredoxin